jgi:hypothetical protein
VLNDVHIATGRIRGANADGIRFANTHTLTNISITNVAIECPAQAVADSAGIAFAGLGTGAGAMRMVQIASNAVHYDPACAGPAAGASGILIRGTDTSHFSILDNQLLGRASSSFSGVGIGLTMDAGVSLVAPPILLQALVVGNTIQQFGNAGVQLTASNSGQVLADILANTFIHNCRVTAGPGSHCGAISAVATTTDAMVGGVHISSNTSTEHPYSVETYPASDGTLGPFVIDANEMSDTDDYYWSTSPADSGGLFEGLVETHRAGANLFSNRSPSSIKLTNGTGTNVDSGTVVCLTTTANSTFIVCTAATKSRLVGVLNERTANTTLGAILTRGIVHFVGCTGTVARGDLLETNDSGQAITAVTPAVGAVLGKALSTCSGGHLTALVSVG